MDVSTQDLELTQTEEPVVMSESEALLEEQRSSKRAKVRRVLIRVARYARVNLLLILIVIGALAGVIVGLAVREAHPSDTTKLLIGFPGEIFLRSITMLILPLIVFSLITGLGTLDIRTAGAMGGRTLLYYITTTALAIGLGLLLVLTIRPGASHQLLSSCTNESHSAVNQLDTLDSFLDLIR